MLNLENNQREREKQSKINEFISQQFSQPMGRPDLKQEISKDLDTMFMQKASIFDLKVDSK